MRQQMFEIPTWRLNTNIRSWGSVSDSFKNAFQQEILGHEETCC